MKRSTQIAVGGEFQELTDETLRANTPVALWRCCFGISFCASIIFPQAIARLSLGPAKIKFARILSGVIMSSLRLGDIAPDFEQDSSLGRIQFHQWLGDSWGVLFSHPADFTPVCTTELGLTAKLKDEFARRGVKAIALSVDPVDSHKKWIEDIDSSQRTTVNFPILADADRKVSVLYDLIHPNASATATVRSLFVIDPAKRVRLIITYPASTGRNFDEILRVIDSLQLTDNYSVATPGNWKHGDDVVIVPSIQDPEVIKQKFPKGFVAVKPYLRITPQPNLN